MGENYITYEDIPLRNEYIDQLKADGIKIKNKLKWFNAVSAYMTNEQLNRISSLNFIKSIEPVKIFKFKNKTENSLEKEIKPGNSSFKSNIINGIDYGTSFTQLDLIDIPKVHERGITGENVNCRFPGFRF